MNPPKMRDARRTRGSVLEAAERIFERDGWRETTLAAVGVQAGVSRGTPAYFFGSKAGLYAAMGARLVDAARERASAVSAGDPLERLAALLSGQLEVVAARPAFARLAFDHWGRAPATGADKDETGFASLERDLIRRMVELLDSMPGRSPDPEPGAAAAALLMLAWSAGLPGLPGGRSAAGSGTLSDRSALLGSIVRKIFVDNGSGAGQGAPGEAPRVRDPESGLLDSKERRWRLPGVG